MENNQKDISILERYVSGEASSAFWNVATKGVGIINTFFIISALSLYQYGVFQLFLATYAFSSLFVTAGGGVAVNDIIRFIGEKKEARAKKLFYELNVYRLIISVILWIIVFFGAPFLSFKYGPDFIIIIKIISFYFLSSFLLKFISNVFLFRLKFEALASRIFFEKAIQLGVLVYFFFFGTIGIKEVVLSQLIGQTANIFILLPGFFIAYSPWRNIKASKESIFIPIMLSYGKWAVIRPFIGRSINFIQPWIIKFFVNTESVAIFSVAQSMVSLYKGLLPAKTLSTLIPLRIHDREKSQKMFTLTIKYLTLFSFLTVLAGVITAPVGIYMFFAKYISSLPIFFILILRTPLLAASLPLSLFITALRKQKFLFYNGLLSTIFTIIFSTILTFLFGIWGMAVEKILTSAIMFFVSYVYLVKIRPGVEIRWKDIFSFGEEDRVIMNNVYLILLSFIKKPMDRIRKYI